MATRRCCGWAARSWARPTRATRSPSRCPTARLKDRSEEIVEGFHALDLDALIGVGGDGSLKILSRLAIQGGIPFVGIPKTIDNDVARTERAVGYTTAVATATEALDRLQPTAASHDRVMILEVMGRDAGHIAIAAGIAGGADVVLIPEIAWNLQTVSRACEGAARRRPQFRAGGGGRGGAARRASMPRSSSGPAASAIGWRRS